MFTGEEAGSERVYTASQQAVSGGGTLLSTPVCLPLQSAVFVAPGYLSHSPWGYCVRSAGGRGVHQVCGLEEVASWKGKGHREQTLLCEVSLLYSYLYSLLIII